jgi:hypothetical protein
VLPEFIIDEYKISEKEYKVVLCIISLELRGEPHGCNNDAAGQQSRAGRPTRRDYADR